MTLRQQILSSLETLSDLAWAAEQRARDGEELLAASRFSGAVYLFGLAVEMWLKLACFRKRGAGPATTVASQLGPARQWMSMNSPGVPAESYHSLHFWVEYLIKAPGPAISSAMLGQLRHHVIGRLFQDWKIDIRYRFEIVPERHAWRVYCDRVWMRQTWDRLWR